jgi:hypothetical protein
VVYLTCNKADVAEQLRVFKSGRLHRKRRFGTSVTSLLCRIGSRVADLLAHMTAQCM